MKALRRTMEELQRRQAHGCLRVRTSTEFRRDVVEVGLEEAYAGTDVLAAGSFDFCDQASLLIHLGPCDPPLRIQRAELSGIALCCGSGNSLTLPMAAGDDPQHNGATILLALLQGSEVSLVASGKGLPQYPQRELATRLDLHGLGVTRLHLPRAMSENGLVAVNSSDTRVWSMYGPLLERFGNAVFTGPGGRSVGLTSPRFGCLGLGSPVFIAGATGVVVGTGAGHRPYCHRLESGHALAPGASVAVSVDAAGLEPKWLRSCWFGELGAGLMVGIAAPVPLLNRSMAAAAGVGDADLQAPVLDFSIPRRIRPSFGFVPYSDLLAGQVSIAGRVVRTAAATSLALAEDVTAALAQRLRNGDFPLTAPLQPLPMGANVRPVNA